MPSDVEGKAVDRSAHFNVEGFQFARVAAIEPEKTDGVIQEFFPQSRDLNKKHLPLNAYGSGPFCKFQIPKSYAFAGVYVLKIDDEIVYVGECENLSRLIFRTPYEG